jgi:hypothetical protein
MPFSEMTVMIAVIAAVVLGFIHLLRLVGTLMLHRTLRKVVEKDPTHAEALLSRLAVPRPKDGDDRLATILISLGIAMIAASVVINDPQWIHYGVAAALFPLIIGTALWVRGFVLARTGRRAAGE